MVIGRASVYGQEAHVADGVQYRLRHNTQVNFDDVFEVPHIAMRKNAFLISLPLSLDLYLSE